MKIALILITPFLLSVAYAKKDLPLYEDLNPQNPKHNFVGAGHCRMCHSSPSTGNQAGIWQNSPHAHAYETLGTQKAIELGKSVGVPVPQKSPYCLQCHVTAYGTAAQFKGPRVRVEDSISCESCHGPGSDYAKMSVMRNLGEAIAKGLIKPTPETCKMCHNRKRQPGGLAGGPEYNFKEMFQKIKHYRPGSRPAPFWQ